MSSLYTGVSGLQVNQRGLTVAGHNLANVETEGYVRQQMETTDSFYTTIGNNRTGLIQTGYGSDVSSIKQVRDRFLDATFREENGRKGFYGAQYDATLEIEDIFGETEGVAFQDSLESLWTSMQELCKEPDSIVKRSSFIQTAVSFIDRAEEVYKQIGDYQISLNKQVQTYVDRINSIAQEIYGLNHEIEKIEAAGFENANDLRDQRNLLLDELSEIINISYKEDSKGVVTVVAEGYTLLSEDLVYEIKTKPVDENSKMVKPYWPDYNGVDVFMLGGEINPASDTDIGALKGLLVARGEKVGRYTDIPREPVEEDYIDATGWFDEDSYQRDVHDYKDAVEKYELEVESSVCVSVQAQFDNLVHGIVTAINDILCPNKEVLLSSGERILVYDMESAPVGMDEDHTFGEALFNRKSMDRYEYKYITIVNPDNTTEGYEAWVYNGEDKNNNYSLFTLGEIEVNQEILKSCSKLPLSENSDTGDFRLDVCEEMLTKWQSAFDRISPSDFSKQNFDSYYTEMIGLLGTNGQKYKKIFDSQESLVNSVENQRQAVLAVDSDEDLAYVIKFQQGYNASSRFINAVNEMLEHLLDTLGR